jgi:Bacterial PH domain
VSTGAVHGSGGPPRGGRWTRLPGRLSTAARAALIVVLGMSVLAIFGGLVFLEWTVVTIGFIGLIGIALLVDIATAASQVVEGDDLRQLRTRRRLAVLELLTIVACFAGSWYVAGGWDVFVTLPEQLAFGLLWTATSAATVIIFRALRRRRGISEPPAPPSYHPEDSPEVAERFWSDRMMRHRWWICSLLLFFGLLGIAVATVLLGGDDPTVAMLILFGLLIPLLGGVAALASHWKVPLMSALPPRPLPEVRQIPLVVRFRPRLNVLRLASIVPIVLVPMCVAIAFEMSSGEAAIMSRGGAVAIAVVGGVVMLGTLAAAWRSGRVAVGVGPDGIWIVNFFHTHEIPWGQVAAVEAAPQRIARMLAIGVTGAIGQDVTLSSSHPLCVCLRNGEADPALVRRIRATASVDQDPERSRSYGELVVALRREAEAHGVPVRF